MSETVGHIGCPTLLPGVMSESEARDRAALQHLCATYCHAIDRRDFNLLRSLYHDDAIDDHSPMYCGPVNGFIAWLPEVISGWKRTVHLMHTSLFLIQADKAEGQISTTAYHLALDGSMELIIHGRYVDRYEKRNDIWRFSYRSLVLDWLEERPCTSASHNDREGAVSQSAAGPADPSYARLYWLAQDRQRREAIPPQPRSANHE